MHLRDIPAGSRVFVDATIFFDHITKDRVFGKACMAFLQRIENGEIQGFTSVIVLNELLHKLVIGEVRQKHRLSRAAVIRFIDKNPSVLKGLKAYWLVADIAAISNLQVLDVLAADFAQAATLMEQHHLLSNDALHIAVMRRNGLDMLASNDSDFQRVLWLKLYQP